jgi:hypothetical protein
VETEVVNGEPLQLGDLLALGQSNGDLVIEVPVQDVRTTFLIRDYDSFWTRPEFVKKEPSMDDITKQNNCKGC